MATDWTSKDPTEWTYGVAGSGGGSGGGADEWQPVNIPQSELDAPSRDVSSIHVSGALVGDWYEVEISPAGANTANPTAACVFSIPIPGLTDATIASLSARAPRQIIIEIDLAGTDDGVIICVLPSDAVNPNGGTCGARIGKFSTAVYGQITSGTGIVSGTALANLTATTVLYTCAHNPGAGANSVGVQTVSLLNGSDVELEGEESTLNFTATGACDQLLVTVGTNATSGGNKTAKFRAWVLFGQLTDVMSNARSKPMVSVA